MPQTLGKKAPVLRRTIQSHKTIGTSAQRLIATWIMLASMMVCMGNSATGEVLHFPDSQNTNATPSQQDNPQDQQQPPNAGFTLPAGTKLPLGLVRPLSVKSAKPGTSVYLQVTFPVSVGNQMLVPPGTYVEGTIDKVLHRDRGRATLEFTMSSASLIFSNGYTVSIQGTVTVSPTMAEISLPPTPTGDAVPAMAAFGSQAAPPPLPPLPPLPGSNGGRNAIIGLGIAGAVVTVFGIVFAVHHSDIEMETGTPMEIILTAPISLDVYQAMSAVQKFDEQSNNAPREIVQPPKRPAICYDSGSPGTPDTVIPGTPGTPDTVIPGMNGAPDMMIPGIPSTPDTLIPGTPGTPPNSYPCPR
jgi:hypothetical protein